MELSKTIKMILVGTFTFAVFTLAGCGQVTSVISSSRNVSDGSVLLSLSSSKVDWDGTQLLGNLTLKASTASGTPVAGYTPQVTVVSTSAISSSFFGKVGSFFAKTLGFAKNDISVQSTMTYTLLPCPATDADGLASCQIKVLSGTGQLNILVSGASTTTPLEISLVVNAPPTVSSISPSTVPAGSVRSTITITGANFFAPMEVKVGSITCENVNVVSATQLTCEITSNNVLGLKNVSVKAPDRQEGVIVGALAFVDVGTPAITVTQKPTALVNSSIADIAFTLSDDILTPAELSVACLIDSAPVTCSSFAVHLTGLADGPHSFVIQTSDTSGHSATTHIDWNIDTAAPTLSMDSSALGSSPSASTAARSLTMAGADVVAYKALISRTGNCAGANFSSVTETAVATPFAMPITTDGNYTVCAIGRDTAGNWQSTPTVSSTIAIDTSIPYIVSISGALTSPSNLNTARTITMNGNSTAAYKAVTVKNGTDCSAADFSAVSETAINGSYTLTFSGDGSYFVCAIGRNTANVWQTTATKSSTLVIDTVPSSIAAFSLGTSPSASKTARTVYFSGTDIIQYKALSFTSGSCDTTALSAVTAQSTATPFNLAISTDGSYSVCAIGVDSAGNWQTTPTAAGPLVIDATAPVLSKSAPANGTQLQGAVTITGTCETGLNVRVTGDIVATANTTCASSTYTLNPVLSTGDGSKALIISSSDAALNLSQISFSLIKDSTAPVLAFTSPAANAGGINGITIAGTCESGLNIDITGAGLAAPTTGSCVNGSFLENILFSSGDGVKNIILTQTDAAGNTTVVDRDFSKDTTPPALSLSLPAANTAAKNGVTLSGTCETGLSVQISGSGIASATSTACAAGTFSQAIVFSATDGNKSISLAQTDAAGNTTSVSRTFIRDNVAPVIMFASTSVQNQSNNLNTVTFSGACESGATITSTLGGVADSSTTCASDQWSLTTATQISDAVRTYIITATDAATNSSSITGTWTRDATAPTLTLQYPTLNALVKGGTDLQIQWTGADPNLELLPVKLEYSANGGTSWSLIAPALTNSGSYNWPLPSINTVTAQIRVTLTDAYGNARAISSPNFSIDSTPPLVTLTSLTGGQLLKGGSAQNITWTASDTNITSTPISLHYSQDNGATWTLIAGNLANNGTYSWTPTVNGTAYMVRVTAVDSVGLTGQSASNNAFAVDALPPTISNVTLNGQSSVITVGAGSTINIAWTVTDANLANSPIDLQYSTNAGTTWNAITSSSLASSVNSYSWNISSLAFADGDNYAVKVIAKDKVGNSASVQSSLFKVRSTAPSLTFGSGVNTNLYSNTNTVTYSGTCTNGLSIVVSGSANSTATCSSGTWTWTQSGIAADGDYNYTFAQDNGLATSVSAKFTRDTVAPVLTFSSINDGATSTDQPNVSAALAATDTNMSGLSYQILLANISTQTCPTAGTVWNAFPNAGSGTFNYTLIPPDGNKTLCAWVKDAAGNISTLASRSITFGLGTPPRITSFTVSNGVLSTNYGTTSYLAGDTVKITWTAEDTEALANNPVFLDYSADGTTWSAITSGYGNLSGNPTSYSADYTGFSAPATFFLVRIRVRDKSGNWAIPLVSAPQNSGAWGVVAGTKDRGIDSGSKTAVFGTSVVSAGLVAMNPANGDMYAIDKGNGIVKISASTGIVSRYLSEASSANLSNAGGKITSALALRSYTSGLIFRGGYLYLLASDGNPAISAKIFRIDPKDDSYVLYFGGGTDTSTSATPTTGFVMPDAFQFDESNSLYFFTSCASPTSSYSGATHTVRLMKVAQKSDGTAGAVSQVAGNCVNGTPVSGTAAMSTPLGGGTNVGYSSLAVWNNGNAIFYRLQQNSTVYKILNGTLYSTSISTGGNSYTGLTYNPNDGKLYVSPSDTMAYTPNLSGANGDGTGTTVVTSAGTTNCAEDNMTAATQACTSSNRSVMTEGGQLLILDGATSADRPYRIRYIDANGKFWTLAGSQPYYGNGLNPLFNRGRYGGILYKRATADNLASLTTFPEGLYFTDPSALVFGVIKNNVTSLIWGNQSGRVSGNTYVGSYVASTSQTYGAGFGRPNFTNLSLGMDKSGFPYLRTTWSNAVTLDNALHPTLLTSSTNSGFNSDNWMYADPATKTPADVSYYFALNNNTTMKDTGTRRGFFSLAAFYSGTWTSPGPVLRFFDFKNNQITHVMGAASTAAYTADATTATNLTSATFPAACQTQNNNACYTRFVENDPTTEADDVLYYTEGTRIRAIKNPLNPGSQTLTTLLNENAALTNLIVTDDGKHIYYLMNGYLYCFSIKLVDQTNECRFRAADTQSLVHNDHQHGPLGPPAGMAAFPTGAHADSMTWKDPKTLLISNNDQIFSFTIPQPTQVTKNLIWGVNMKKTKVYTGVTAPPGQPITFDVAKMRPAYQELKRRGIKAARVDAVPTAGNVQLGKYYVQMAQENDLKLTFTLMIEWLQAPSDAKTFTTNDLDAIYTKSYNATYSYVMNFVDTQNGTSSVTDWELGNELDIKINQTSSPGGYNVGYEAADWENISAYGTTHYFENWAAAIKGGSDAINAINSQYGLQMRTLVNFVGTHTGFIKFMMAKGIKVDVATYHAYPRNNSTPYALWQATQPGTNAPLWNLFAGLADLKIPISLNEINCGEIYDSDYQNDVNDPKFKSCLEAVKQNIGNWKNNSQINLESIYMHMLLDDPNLVGAEQKFGMMWVSTTDNMNYTYTPKPGMFLFSLFAGGSLTPAEQDALTTFITLPLP